MACLPLPAVLPYRLPAPGQLCPPPIDPLTPFHCFLHLFVSTQDVVERFHLLLILAFVVVEEMGNRCAPRWLLRCLLLLDFDWLLRLQCRLGQ